MPWHNQPSGKVNDPPKPKGPWSIRVMGLSTIAFAVVSIGWLSSVLMLHIALRNSGLCSPEELSQILWRELVSGPALAVAATLMSALSWLVLRRIHAASS